MTCQESNFKIVMTVDTLVCVNLFGTVDISSLVHASASQVSYGDDIVRITVGLLNTC